MAPHVDAQRIVDNHTFILATRDTGYRDVAAAVAELIDNSLQANASNIHVFVREDDSGNVTDSNESRDGIITISVLDNGCGMSAETLRTALRFGGTNRFDDRTGFGRFGMGLPNGSVSQTRRLDVYSWQQPGTPFFSYLDIDEIASGRLQAIPTAKRKPLPNWLKPYSAPNGTAVIWSRCDRLGRMRATTISQRLTNSLGRMFRSAIWAGTNLRVNDESVPAMDPLFLRGVRPPNMAKPYGNRLLYNFSLSDGEQSSTVEVQFAELPISRLHGWSTAEKRRSGIVGGAGVSIVRAGREIDYGWHLMGDKRRENYDDWWRCEIRFSPALDELFGVTHSKQGINPTTVLQNALAPDLGAIARTLNGRVRAAFESLKTDALTPATARATATDQFLSDSISRSADRLGGLRYRIDVKPLASGSFYLARLRAGRLTLTLNQDHPFFSRVYEPACGLGRERERFAIECLLLAVARADAVAVRGDEAETVQRVRGSWSDTLAAFLDKS